MFLAHEKLSIKLFIVLWHHYKNSLLICEINTYRDFIANQYFNNLKELIEFNSLVNTDPQFKFIILRAEKTYFDSNIFKNIN